MKKLLAGSLLAVSSLLAGDVLAVVGGEEITKTQINNLLAAQKLDYDKLPPQYQQKILEQIITEGLLIKKAQDSGVSKTKLYKDELKKLEKQLALRVFLKQKIDSFKISNSDIKNFYNKNRDLMFKQKEQVKARHILVKTEAEAKDIISQLKSISQNKLQDKFIELAKKYSNGPTGKNGGELGWFSKDKMIPEFSKVAFSLNKGAFSFQPVKTRFGWHVIYVEDKKSGGYIPFDKIKEQIKQLLKKQKLGEYIKELKDKAHIQYK
jgi:parvulin-like peptidyl-prolyl isomerase